MESYNDRYKKHRKFLTHPVQEDIAWGHLQNVIDDHVKESNDSGFKLVALAFGSGVCFGVRYYFADSRLLNIILFIGFIACTAGMFYILNTAPKRRGQVIYDRYVRDRRISLRMKQARTDLINEMLSRAQYLGSDVDSEIQQLLIELKEIDKIEDQLLHDNSIP